MASVAMISISRGIDPRTDEVGDLFEDVGENIVGDVGVSGVHTDNYRPLDLVQSNT